MNSKVKLPLQVTVALSMLAAVSIVMGKYLAFGVGDILRFSFENLPVLFAGIAFGPIAGLLVGAVADLVGCLLVGYAVNPLVTVGAALIGLVGGAVYRLAFLFGIKRRSTRIILSVALGHLIGSVAVKTLGLAIFYSMPIPVLMLWRILNYAIVGLLEGVILVALMQNKSLVHQLSAMKGGRGEKKKEE